MEINIRGALGTQVFEYVLGLARAKMAGETVTHVNVNVFGGIVQPAKVDWISKIIDVPYPVRIIQSTAKQGVWNDPENFKDIIKSGVLEDVVCKVDTIPTNYDILHVRGKDRIIASTPDYTKLMHVIGRDVKLVGDDNDLIDTVIRKVGFGENISVDEITDWAMLKGCRRIYCAFTNYPLSALLFNPYVEINMLSAENSNGYVNIEDDSYSGVDVFFKEYLKNGRWI